MRMATRESDERMLEWLSLADNKVPQKEIARRYGVKLHTVEQALYKIRRDDRLAHEE